MGGGGSKQTVTNSYTGLGDDQFASLSDNQNTMIGNQANIAGSIDTARSEAEAAYGNIYDRFGNLDLSQEQIQNLIGRAGDDPTGLYKQFADQNTNLTDQFSSVVTGQGQLSSLIGTRADQLAGGQTNLNDAMSGRFDSINTGLGANLDAIGGVSDQVTGVSDQVTDVADVTDRIDDNTQDLSGDLSDLAVDQKAGFGSVTDDMEQGFDDAIDDREAILETAQEERNALGDNLDTLGDNQADYYGDLADTLGDVQSTTDEYVSDFDDYIDRYGDDVKAATSERADILEGTEDEFGRLREDIGNYTDAVSGYTEDTDEALETGFAGLGNTVEGGFDTISDEVGEGFTDTEGFIQDELTDLNLEDRFEKVVDTLGGDLSQLDQDVMSEFAGVMDAFDEQGVLIESEVAANGDVISRRIDKQGNLIEDRFDAQGTLIGSTETNLNDALTKVEASLGTGLTGVTTDVSKLFDAQNATLTDQGAKLLSLGVAMDGLNDQQRADMQTVSSAFDQQGKLIESEVASNGDLISRRIDEQGVLIEDRFDAQGTLIGTTETNLNDALTKVEASLGTGLTGVTSDVANLFDAQNAALSDQGSQLLSLGMSMDDLNDQQRADMQTISNAFDQQGKFIESEVAANGDVISRRIDDQGMLIEDRFDAQGMLIGTTETNLNDALMQVEGRIGSGLMGVTSDVSNLFDVQNATLSDQGSQLLSLGAKMGGLSDQQRTDMQAVSGAFDAQGNLIRTSQDAMGNLVEREMDENGNLITRAFDDQGNLLNETSLNVTDVMSGLSQLDTIQGQVEQGFSGVQDTLTDQSGMMSEMSADQQAAFATTQEQILGGFDTSSEIMDTQIRDIAGVASQMSDLDMGMRQQFYQLGGAFDDNGELIKESVDDNGNLIQRSIDTNGNILLRAFDQTGNEIGQNVINIGKALGDLAGVDTLPGANISMGNLTAPLQANPDPRQPNVPVSGFMAPYTETI